MSGKLDFARPHVVYRAFDADGCLLYVGMTGSWWRRMGEHSRRSVWFGHASTWVLDGYENRHVAWTAEQAAIKSEHPIHNTTYSEIGYSGARTQRRKRLIAEIRRHLDSVSDGVLEDIAREFGVPILAIGVPITPAEEAS